MTRREQDLLSAASIATFKLNGRFLALAEELAGPAGLTAAWWQVLGAVLGGPLPVDGIAREMGLTRQSVQRTSGHPGRARPSQTARQSGAPPAKLLVPTGAGRAAIGRIGPGHADAAGRLAAALGEDALAGAVDMLRGLSAALDQLQPAPVMTRTSGS